jgi:hypothetical protein
MASDITFDRVAEEDPYARERWAKVRDVVSGDQAMRAGGYLPYLNKKDQSEDNKERNASYVARAVFYNATGRTLSGLMGLVFKRDPRTNLPEKLAYLQSDADGAGMSIYQQSQQAVAGVLRAGRFGLYLDVDDKRNQPIIKPYSADNICNWAYGPSGLELVVLKESVAERNGFGVGKVTQYRELRMEGGVFVCQLWRQAADAKEAKWEKFGPEVKPSLQGRTLGTIPFKFIGSETNDAAIDMVPLYDLACLNIAHFRNSADYEDSVFMHGQPQAYIAGLTEEWRDHLEKSGAYVGSRSLLPLPAGGTFAFAQPQANSLVREAMDQKEGQMVALGARLLDQNAVSMTATQNENDRESSTSVLSQCAANVTEAYQAVIGWAAQYLGAPLPSEQLLGSFKLNQDFTRLKIDAAALTALVGAWQSGVIAKFDLRAFLRAEGVLPVERKDDDIDADINSDGPALGTMGLEDRAGAD